MKQPNAIIQFFSTLFIILGSLALSIFYITSWANSLIFNTNYYLGVVTPLPKNTDVAKAMGTYTTDTLFTKTNIEERIHNALPEQTKFLSSSLSDQLQSRSYQRTTKIIQSDQFSSVWVAANTFFHQRVLNIVRGGGILSQLNDKQFLQNRSLQFDGSQLTETIKNQLGTENELFNNSQVQQLKTITIPVFTKLEKIRQIVYWISQLASMLLPLSLALLLYGIALSFSRQRAFLIAGTVLILSMVITLVTIQIIKTDFLHQITQSIYNASASTVWDSFFGGLKMALWLTILGGIVVTTLALAAGPYQWARNLRKNLGIPQMQRSRFITGLTKLRINLSRYNLWLRLLGIIVVIIVLLMMQATTLATVVITLSWLLIYLAFLSFLFPRQKQL